jgi:hypothetical protein
MKQRELLWVVLLHEVLPETVRKYMNSIRCFILTTSWFMLPAVYMVDHQVFICMMDTVLAYTGVPLYLDMF